MAPSKKRGPQDPRDPSEQTSPDELRSGAGKTRVEKTTVDFVSPEHGRSLREITVVDHPPSPEPPTREITARMMNPALEEQPDTLLAFDPEDAEGTAEELPHYSQADLVSGSVPLETPADDASPTGEIPGRYEKTIVGVVTVPPEKLYGRPDAAPAPASPERTQLSQAPSFEDDDTIDPKASLTTPEPAAPAPASVDAAPSAADPPPSEPAGASMPLVKVVEAPPARERLRAVFVKLLPLIVGVVVATIVAALVVRFWPRETDRKKDVIERLDREIERVKKKAGR